MKINHNSTSAHLRIINPGLPTTPVMKEAEKTAFFFAWELDKLENAALKMAETSPDSIHDAIFHYLMRMGELQRALWEKKVAKAGF